MALGTVGINLTKLLVTSQNGRILSQKLLLKRLLPIQVSGICGKAFRDKDIQKPAPWPYKEKQFNFFHGLYDRTTSRLDENSKIIVVEGPIASGKTEFAKALAEDLDMLHLPEVTMDMYYINPYGYDMRKLDPELPSSCRSFDVKNFYQDPTHVNVGNYQVIMFGLRYSQYIDALAHVLNTGQGVVLERCCYSDNVFMDAMFKSNFVNRDVRNYYYEVRENTLNQIMKPHLVIYLDVPVSTCLDRVKKRNVSYEVNSKVLTPQYLQMIEDSYKTRYLKEISTHAELLIYDWSSYGDVEVVVEDIERIDFDRFEKHDPKMKDWRLYKEWDWNIKRNLYTTKKYSLMNFLEVPTHVPELIITGGEAKDRQDVWFSAPGMRNAVGYNTDMGDQNIVFKTKSSN